MGESHNGDDVGIDGRGDSACIEDEEDEDSLDWLDDPYGHDEPRKKTMTKRG